MIDAKRERVFGGNSVERLSIFGIASNRTEIDNHLCCGLGRKKIRAAHAKEKQRIQEHVPPPESP